MASNLQYLAPELVHQIYNNLATVSDVVNLSLTCHRLNALLRSAQKLSTLFAAAEREYGPIEDIEQLVTFNHAQPAHLHRSPGQSYALLRQIITVGTLGKRFENIYPVKRWDTDYLNRRDLTKHEAFRVRRAIYRYWLFVEAFGKQLRTQRLLRHNIEERCQLLRNWSTPDLIDIDDVRTMLEEMLSFDICPTDGIVYARASRDGAFMPWQSTIQPHHQTFQKAGHFQHLFHVTRAEDPECELPCAQTRIQTMEGWGDDISQYHVVQSMLKLTPAQIMWLYDNALHKWQVEALVQDLGGDWFWNNGQTFSDAWSVVLHSRGLDIQQIRQGVLSREIGVVPDPNKGGTYIDYR